MELRGKTVWLIGASEGIGAALATRLALAGADLILSARNTALLQQVAASISPLPRIVALDVTDANAMEVAWQELIDAGIAVDSVIYNAGAYEPLEATRFDLQKIEQMIDVNLHGALRVLSHVIPGFVTRNTGQIVLVGSVAGYRGLPSAMGYGLSKAAIIHLAENLRADFAGTGIGVTIVNPGFVKTRLTGKNNFRMPAMITPDRAAEYIMQGFARGDYEIHFPKRFTFVMKLLQLLPSPLYFAALRQLKL